MKNFMKFLEESLHELRNHSLRIAVEICSKESIYSCSGDIVMERIPFGISEEILVVKI